MTSVALPTVSRPSPSAGPVQGCECECTYTHVRAQLGPGLPDDAGVPTGPSAEPIKAEPPPAGLGAVSLPHMGGGVRVAVPCRPGASACCPQPPARRPGSESSMATREAGAAQAVLRVRRPSRSTENRGAGRHPWPDQRPLPRRSPCARALARLPGRPRPGAAGLRRAQTRRLQGKAHMQTGSVHCRCHKAAPTLSN